MLHGYVLYCFEALTPGEVVKFNPTLKDPRWEQLDIYPAIAKAGVDETVMLIKKGPLMEGEPSVVLHIKTGPSTGETIWMPRDLYKEYNEKLNAALFVLASSSEFKQWSTMYRTSQAETELFDPEVEAGKILAQIKAARC